MIDAPEGLEGLAASAMLVEAEVANLRWFAREMVSVDGDGAAGTMPRFVLEMKGDPDVLTRIAAYTEIAATIPAARLPAALAATLGDNAGADEGAAIACRVADPTRRALYVGAILAFESAELNSEGRQLDVWPLLDAIPQPQRGETLRLLDFLSSLNHFFKCERISGRALDS